MSPSASQELSRAPLGRDERDLFIAALAAEKLVTADLERPGRRFFSFRGADGGLIGFGGLEGDGADILLRSIVILPEFRGRGHGAVVVAALAEAAASQDAETLWLLTETAGPYFARLGFDEIDRADAPATIQDSDQFQGICPETATLMRRRVG